MVTKVNFKGFNKVKKELIKRAQKALSTKRISKEITKIYIDELRASGGLKALKRPETINSRRRIASSNRTHSSYSLNKSNATITGEFLKNVKFKYLKTRKRFELSATGKHKGYKGVNGKRGKASNNRDILEGQTDRSLKGSKNSLQGVARRRSVKKNMADAIAKVIKRFI